MALLACVLGCNAVTGLDSLEFERTVGSGGGAQASSSSGSQGGETAASGGAGPGGSAGAQPYDFFDGFDRPNGGSLENGWIEKLDAAFAILDEQVVKAAVPTSYRDNMVYRPPIEDVLDVEISIELALSALPDGNPQIFARVQSTTVALANTYDGYLFWIDDTGAAALLSRQNGIVFATELASFPLDAPLDFSSRYRMRLRVAGTDPVSLEGRVERLDGTRWIVVGEGNAVDSDSARIAAAGAVGFSGAEEASYIYDNFTRLDL